MKKTLNTIKAYIQRIKAQKVTRAEFDNLLRELAIYKAQAEEAEEEVARIRAEFADLENEVEEAVTGIDVADLETRVGELEEGEDLADLKERVSDLEDNFPVEDGYDNYLEDYDLQDICDRLEALEEANKESEPADLEELTDRVANLEQTLRNFALLMRGNWDDLADEINE